MISWIIYNKRKCSTCYHRKRGNYTSVAYTCDHNDENEDNIFDIRETIPDDKPLIANEEAVASESKHTKSHDD